MNVKKNLNSEVSGAGRFIGIVIILILFIATIWFYYANMNKENIQTVPPTNVSEDQFGSFNNFAAEIISSMATIDDPAVDLYYIDLVSKEIVRPNTVMENVRYTPTISLNGKKLIYSAAPVDQNSPHIAPYSEVLQITRYDTVTKEEIAITSSNTLLKRLPELSPDETQIAFSTIAREYEGDFSLFPNDWEVFITNLDGEEVYISKGVAPQWSPDGDAIVFLNNDGLYLYDLGTKTKVRVIEARGELQINNKVKVSSGGDRLAWTSGGANELLIYNIDSWDLPKFTLSKRYDLEEVSPYWPIFTSNDRYVVFQGSEKKEDETRTNSLYAIDLLTEEVREMVDLSNFDVNQSYFTSLVE